MMLDVTAKYEHAFDSYARDDNSFFLDLTVRDGVPTFDDWENVRRIVKILQPFYDLTLKDKYNKYRGDATNMNFPVYLAIIIDPRRKMGFVDFGVQQLFPDIASEDWLQKSKESVNLYGYVAEVQDMKDATKGVATFPLAIKVTGSFLGNINRVGNSFIIRNLGVIGCQHNGWMCGSNRGDGTTMENSTSVELSNLDVLTIL
ncbi:hypothetical protein V6N12_069503 [Hibiscus sabdariffa]|uniref:Uncharacterized protein n=1 Tax=Hibiscus sabdariffa TaxID=183260 RepID=A0ABR2FEH3_9ROSI